MGLRDAFRSRKGETDNTGLEDAAGGEHAEDPIRFTPRYDGRYHGEIRLADQAEPVRSAGWLRFSGPRAFWAPAGVAEDDLDAALAPGQDAWTGEYTPAGRFTVQRRFERPVIHTVLDVDDDGFLARVTAPTPAETGMVRYHFQPSVPAPSGPSE